MIDEKNIDLEPPADLPPIDGRKSSSEAVGFSSGQEKDQARALEQGLASPPSTPPQAPITTTAAPQPVPTPGPGATRQSVMSVPVAAEHSDLIEKEWVSKAKEIVERTKSDPYIQNKEMSKVKAEYIKRRYNKDLKLSDN